jgi:hypothetical protein
MLQMVYLVIDLIWDYWGYFIGTYDKTDSLDSNLTYYNLMFVLLSTINTYIK